MLWVFQRVMFGELDNPKNQKLLDLNAREITIMVPLLVMIFFMGLYPKPFIDKMDPAIKKLAAQVRVASVDAQMIPAADQMQMPAGHPGMQQQMPAGQPGSEMPAGHPGMEPSSAPHAAPIVNQHDVK
jgi:NADH-quinone oxidoreductase subunit M